MCVCISCIEREIFHKYLKGKNAFAWLLENLAPCNKKELLDVCKK